MGTIKVGDKELSEEEVMAIVQQAQQNEMAGNLADQIISAYKQGSGIALNMNIVLGPEDVRQICEPTHPCIPDLLMHRVCEDARVRGLQSMGAVFAKVAEKMGPPPIDPGSMDGLLKAGLALVQSQGGMNGALDITPVKTDPEDEGQVG